MQTFRSIAIVGGGNVAKQLAVAFDRAGIRVNSWWNRTPQKIEAVAAQIGAAVVPELRDLEGSPLIVCCVSDDVLPELLPHLSEYAPVASTSGTIDVLPYASRFPVGVFYPLQSFSANRMIDFQRIPLLIEATTPLLSTQLTELASQLTLEVQTVSWEKRRHLHLAAVFVNNFTNHLIDLAQQQLHEQELPFRWLQPLLEETVAKLNEQSAYDAQTGPARRNDRSTLEQHLKLIPEKDKALYRMLTSSILARYNHDQL